MSRNAALISVYDALIGGAPLQRLVDIVRDYIENPIAVCNCNLETIAFSNETGIDDEIWTMVTSEDENLHYEFEMIGKGAGLVDKVNGSRKPLLISLPLFERRYMNCAFFCGDTVLGNVVLLEYYRQLTDEDSIFLNSFCRILAYYTATEMDIGYAKNPNAELTMFKLLNNDYVPLKTVSRYLFEPKAADVYFIAVIDTANERLLHRRLLLEMKLLTFDYPSAKATIFKEKVILLFQTNIHRSELDAHLDRLKKTLDKMDLVCGISNPFNNITELHLFYVQAITAIKYGERFEKNDRLHFYQDVSFLHLLDLASQNIEISQFCHSALNMVLEYDRKYKTKWFRSLYIYLYFDCDVRMAAEVLDINRNSMYYRVNKLQEIMGYAFKNQNFVFQMRLSISILYYLNGEIFYKTHDIPEDFPVTSFF